MTKTLYLHCGTSKTGTTALQAALRHSETELKQAGFIYPYAGSLDELGKITQDVTSCAHRNIAWQLMRSRYFSRRLGDLNALRTEIENFDGNVILSCEDFETILDAPQSFAPIMAMADGLGYDICIVVYLRNQISYFESLFSELLKHGTGDEARALVDTILAEGKLRTRDCRYQFDYLDLLSAWNKFPEVKLVVRNFHDLKDGSIVSDFADIVGLSRSLVSRPGFEKTNSRNDLNRSATLFFQNRAGREPSLKDIERINFLCRKATDLRLGAGIRQRFVERFQADNLKLCSSRAIDPRGLDLSESSSLSDHATAVTEGNDALVASLRGAQRRSNPSSGALALIESFPAVNQIDQPSAMTPSVTFEQFFSFESHLAIRFGSLPMAEISGADVTNTDWMKGVDAVGNDISLADALRHNLHRVGRYRRWYLSRLLNSVSRFWSERSKSSNTLNAKP